MISDRNKSRFQISNYYLYLLITFVISIFLFYIAKLFDFKTYKILHKLNIFTWYAIFEFLSVVFAFIIFNNCYYSYKHTKRLRVFILSLTFFLVGFIDLFHILNCDGIHYTVTQALPALSTIYWIIARMIMSLGIFITAVVPFYKKSKLNEKTILILGAPIILFIFYATTWRHGIVLSIFNERNDLTRLILFLEYTIMIFQILSIAAYLKTYANITNKYIMILCSGLLFSIFSEILLIFNKDIYNICNLLGHMYKIIGYYLICFSIFKYNIDIPYIQLKKAQNRIKRYADNLEKIIDRRTKEIREVNDRLLFELDYAKKIQQSILPNRKIEFKGVKFVSEYIPCERLSGDFYDIYELDNENIGMYILDVSGHGISAALMTMFTNHYIKSSERLIKRYRGLKPHKNLKYFYEEFNKLNFPEEMHIVIFYAAYNLSSKVLTYCSGGLNCYPILVRKNGEYEFLDKSEGFPICKYSEFYTPEYNSVKIELKQGDKILFYTDGLTDTRKNKTFDKKELIDLLIENRDKDVEVLNDKILQRINSSNERNDDDITYFIMEIK